MFSVINVYLGHLKLCVVCMNGRMYVCCGECYVVSDDCGMTGVDGVCVVCMCLARGSVIGEIEHLSNL